jgi:hypothetical protein
MFIFKIGTCVPYLSGDKNYHHPPPNVILEPVREKGVGHLKKTTKEERYRGN